MESQKKSQNKRKESQLNRIRNHVAAIVASRDRAIALTTRSRVWTPTTEATRLGVSETAVGERTSERTNERMLGGAGGVGCGIFSKCKAKARELACLPGRELAWKRAVRHHILDAAN